MSLIELSEESFIYAHHVKLYRIRAKESFYHDRMREIKKGQLGGWVESLDNIADEAWIDKEGKCFGKGKVCEKGFVTDNGRVMANATVRGNAIILDRAHIYGNAIVEENAVITGQSRVYNNAIVGGSASINHMSCVLNDAVVGGKVFTGSHQQITGGKWSVSPLYIQGTYGSIYISKPGYIMLDVKEYAIDYLLENIETIMANFYPDKKEEYTSYIHFIASRWKIIQNLPYMNNTGKTEN